MNGSTLSQSTKRSARIVIVGRPNVGKSTLFNRMIGKRRSITDPMPGVTRDAVRIRSTIGGHPVELVDTGGYRVDARDIDSLVREKSLQLLEEVDLILMICDVQELNAEDESFIEHLRCYSDKVILVINKVDNPERELTIWNFMSLGFDHVVGISAAHGIGIDILEEKILEVVDFSRFEAGDAEFPRIRLAILGKPNTGKSTLSNRLLGIDASIVSDVPGTTRDVIEGSFSYHGTIFQVMDTAGIRRKKKVRESVEYYSVNRAFATIEESDVILLIVDVQEGLTDQDKKIATQAVKRGKGILLILNKWDTLQDMENTEQAVKDRTRYLFPVLGFAPLIPISAMTGMGVDKMLSAAYQVWKQLQRRVDTPEVNGLIQELVSSYPPPRDAHGHHKIYYGTQVSSNPVKFVLFVNRKKGFPKSYVQYLVNNIRTRLGFTEIPLTVDLKERSGHVR
ncbi:MAG: ribosome biogenesis GTPase Der [Spirochaetota bacterium]|nr:ribosome biogenesis GTPase Der [Spirochaetota bacterium]